LRVISPKCRPFEIRKRMRKMGGVAASTRPKPVSDPAAATAFAAARSICRRHAPDLSFASVFLPVAKRNAVWALYAFARLIRGALPLTSPIGAPSSSCRSPGSEDQIANLLAQRLGDIYYRDQLELPLPELRDEAQQVLYAVRQTIRRYHVPQQHWMELTEGYRLDAQVARYATWAVLERHCRGTGGVIGLIAGCVLGLTHSDAGRHLSQLGVAIRLTHILTNLREDLGAGRLYLPLEDLAEFRVTQRDLSSGLRKPSVRELLKFEIARARRLYREGGEGIRWIAGDGSRMAASTFLITSSAMLGAIERRDYDVFSLGPIRLNNSEKLRHVGAAWRLARRKAGAPLPDVFKR
jgi:phytoene synthase